MATETNEKRVLLGQEAFVVVTTDGGVERTMVGAMDSDGYQFLNGLYNHRTHYFDYDQAVATADEKLKVREDNLRAELRQVVRRRKQLKSEANKTEVMSSPYKVVDLRQVDKKKRVKHLKSVMVPEWYMYPGDSVYTVITPWILSRSEAYRPYSHFVLETQVSTVCFSPDGVPHYTFETRFEVKEYFLLKHKAIRSLESLCLPGSLKLVPFVSFEEDQQKLSEIEDIPF
jgi:hypothetical protein